MLDWLGYEEHELIGKPVGRFLPPEIREHLTEEREAALAGDVRMRLTMLQRKNSTTLPVLIDSQAAAPAATELAPSSTPGTGSRS